MNVKVSVIIPVYNVENYLRQCLDSIVGQTFKDFEIIVVNDCSTDNSGSILEEYAKKDDRFIIINLSENKGQGNARNQGLNIAKGKYITFIDSDDWVAPDYIELLYNEINENNLDVVCASAFLYDNITKKITDRKEASADFLNNIKKERLLVLDKDSFVVTVWAKIYGKNFLNDNEIRFRLDNYHEDNLFIFETIINTNKIKFTDNKIYFYRNNRANSSMSIINKEFTYFSLFSELKKILIKCGKYEQYKKVYYQYISIITSTRLEFLNLKFSESALYFDKFRKLYYTKEFVKNFSVKNMGINFKVRLILFYMCLKFNINYAVVGKFCSFSLRNAIKILHPQ
ncbi:glycosyltransferase family 2 protein [Candidatus Ruminimicrobiellum ovillum]|uniref:glycosyltransferase family 2 protein n=1 Tax=Candidatus Ruminimicrobiellum ovillum TaxID=1947927 RepID=UPI00355A0BA7